MSTRVLLACLVAGPVLFVAFFLAAGILAGMIESPGQADRTQFDRK